MTVQLAPSGPNTASEQVASCDVCHLFVRVDIKTDDEHARVLSSLQKHETSCVAPPPPGRGLGALVSSVHG